MPHENPTAPAPTGAVPAGSPAPIAEPPRPAPEAPARVVTRTGTLLAAVALVAAVALAKAVLVPLALAALFAFLLAPVCSRIERLRVGRGLSAFLSVLLLLGGLGVVGWLTASQVVDLAGKLPAYRRNILAKIDDVQGGALATSLAAATEGLKTLDGAVGTDSEGAADGAAPPVTPVPVRNVEPRRTFLGTLTSVLGPLLAPLAAALVVIVLTVFLLAYRRDIRDRLIRLVSRGQIALTTQALDEAGRRVSRYLAANLLVNTVYGALVGLGLWALGVPNAPLWGLLAGLLRFVPYVGTWIGALLPLAVSFAVTDDWSRTLAVLLVVLGTDLAVGNVVEPLVYGRRTGLSPLTVVLATVFWTWLWGVPGLLLAVPMTLCLAVAGRYVPGLEFLDVLLGDAPALGAAERAYERLLALDPAGARRVVEERIAETGHAVAIEEVLLAALRRASEDRHLGALDEGRLRSVAAGAAEAAEGLAPRAETAASEATAGRVLCLPAGDEPDRAACDLLAGLLGAAGVEAAVAPAAAGSGEGEDGAAREGASPVVVCVASVPPFAGPRVRRRVRRLRRRAPGALVLAVVWDPELDRRSAGAGLADAGADEAAFTLAEAVEKARALLGRAARAGAPAGDRRRVGAV